MPSKNKNEPNWDIDSKRGHQAELWIKSIRSAISDGSIEVKRDERAFSTGNIYVEYQCLRKGKYRPSGLATSKATTWVFVLNNENLAIIISKEYLKKLGRKAYKLGKLRECRGGSHPTKGVVIPLKWLIENET